eukprot:CAMPEP_0173243638 /NCGR_PEP_ID=MMETSP1142-20121109/15622_1 /TAXON_ID=483371 /ORGANISM="non described non described, Strain CCMP2298" /LENGTH=46 /DNA_ID= /DNA_START= /DNA_END= /DNA_ORIENTATION=
MPTSHRTSLETISGCLVQYSRLIRAPQSCPTSTKGLEDRPTTSIVL